MKNISEAAARVNLSELVAEMEEDELVMLFLYDEHTSSVNDKEKKAKS